MTEDKRQSLSREEPHVRSVAPSAPSFSPGFFPEVSTATVPAVAGFSLRCSFDWTAGLSLLLTLLLLPVSYFSARVLTAPITYFFGISSNVLIFFWLLGLAFLAIRPVEEVLVRLFGARFPTEDEEMILLPAWEMVCWKAKVDPDDYALFVQDNPEFNAFAVGVRSVTVTRGALVFPPAQLEAVLAHELGHHVGAHTVVAALSLWLLLPILAVTSVFGFIVHICIKTANFFTEIRLPLLNAIGYFLALLCALPVLVLRGLLWVVGFLRNLIGRGSEFAADAVAVDLGYGDGLVETLAIWMELGDNAEAATGNWREHLFSSCPSPAVRIRRIEKRARNAYGVA